MWQIEEVIMKSYYRVTLGKGNAHAQECFAGNFIGVDFRIDQDLTGKLPDEWRDFNKEFVPIVQKRHPERGRISAGLACGALWKVSKGIQVGDIVLCPDGMGHFHVGEVAGDYYYQKGEVLPHRRRMKWLNKTISRSELQLSVRRAIGTQGTYRDITSQAEELENLFGGISAPKIIAKDETIEDPSEFALEKHLEEFLVQNWKQTEFGKEYNIFEEEGEIVGQQYPTDTGPIDILAVSKDRKTLLVVELKKGRASDVVVGQIMRYIGYVKDELAEKGQNVRGVIIALEDDQRVRRALSAASNIEFYRYQVSFKLVKA
jgi:restriction system protein